jgi:hypothetical protein
MEYNISIMMSLTKIKIEELYWLISKLRDELDPLLKVKVEGLKHLFCHYSAPEKVDEKVAMMWSYTTHDVKCYYPNRLAGRFIIG